MVRRPVFIDEALGGKLCDDVEQVVFRTHPFTFEQFHQCSDLPHIGNRRSSSDMVARLGWSLLIGLHRSGRDKYLQSVQA
jgi:hypothetical protein